MLVGCGNGDTYEAKLSELSEIIIFRRCPL